jgi:hypothetical protein
VRRETKHCYSNASHNTHKLRAQPFHDNPVPFLPLPEGDAVLLDREEDYSLQDTMVKFIILK